MQFRYRTLLHDHICWILVLQITLGAVQLGITYYVYSRAIKHVTALESVLIPIAEPILNPVWTLIALHERPSLWTIMGGTIVLGAVTWRALTSIRQTQETEAALAI